MFRHAGNSGGRIFDGVRVTSIQFSNQTLPNRSIGRPISATYERRSDSESGQITFDYLVDASGRAGILHTKYLKNRIYSKGLKNLAYWGYWNGTSSYGIGTERACSPFFEALKGEILQPDVNQYEADGMQTKVAGRGLSPYTMARHLWELS
jgi:hypothetical protein